MKIPYLVISLFFIFSLSQAFAESVYLCKTEDGEVEFVYEMHSLGFTQLDFSYKGKKTPLFFQSVGRSFDPEKKQLIYKQEHRLTKNSKVGKKDSTFSFTITEEQKEFPHPSKLQDLNFTGTKEGLIKIEKKGVVSFEAKVSCKCQSECKDKATNQGKIVDDSQRGLVEKESIESEESSSSATGSIKQ